MGLSKRMNFTHWGNFFKPARNYFSEKLYKKAMVNEIQERVLNLEDHHQRLLALLGTTYEAIYS